MSPRARSALRWAAAWVLALAGAAGYLLAPDAVTWWLGLALVMPVVFLAAWRAERRGEPYDASGSSDGGAWAPPPDGGGGL